MILHLPNASLLARHSVDFHKILAKLTATTADGKDTEHLSYLALLFAALLMIVNGLLSVYLSLGLHKTLAVAAVRSALSASAAILVWNLHISGHCCTCQHYLHAAAV